MKRTKHVFALLTAVLLCLCLCGCNRLDEMRMNQGFWQKDGTILFNGQTYKKLPAVSDYFNWDTNRTDVFITDADVPVLLSEIMGDGFSVSHGGVLLEGFNSYVDETTQYCRADKYEMVCSMLDGNFEIVTYGYEYYLVDADKLEGYTLTEIQKAGLARIYDTAEKRTQTFEENGEYDVSIYGYSEDKLFCRLLFSLIKDEKGKFTLQNDEHICDVPKADYPLCEEIMKPYIDNLGGEGPVTQITLGN